MAKSPTTRTTPSQYTKELGDEICLRIANGSPLSKIVRLVGMPQPATVYRWIRTYPEFAEQYAFARECQADYYADEIIAISDKATNKDNSPARKVQIEARMWYAAKVRPKVYGNHQAVQITGKDEGPLTTINANVTDPVEAVRLYQKMISGE